MKTSLIISSLLASMVVATPVWENHMGFRNRPFYEARQRRRTTTTSQRITTTTRASTTTSTRASATTTNTTSRAATTTTVTIAAPVASSTSAATTTTVTTATPVASSTSAATTTTVTTAAPVASSTSASTTQSTSTTASVPPSNSGSSDGSATYINPILTQHNLHRANHSAPTIAWDPALAATAQKIAASCVYAHDTSTDGGGYGQNIGAGYLPSGVNGMITNGMYNGEVSAYPGYGVEPDMSNFGAWGHFSQIVWKNSVRLGCYTQYCPNGLQNANYPGVRPYFTVCNYGPPGNYGGQYAQNVGPPRGDPIARV